MMRFFWLLFFINYTVWAQHPNHTQQSNGNPLLPGYFADPTVKKFGDTYYIYATTDGNGGGFGPSQVWISKDFVNWSLQDMNWPTTHHYWAPDVTQANDGKFYMYYCQPVEIFGATSSSPVGPWTPLLPYPTPIVKNFLVPNVITLDGQTFKDDDGKIYMYWGTWGIYPNHGCGVGLLNDDMKSFAKVSQIPNTDAKDFFEAPYMFKRNGIYYLTYSSGRCEDGTYRVQYATSKTGPMGPFVYGKNNPILSTNSDGTIHGPGHQSVLIQDERFYLIYHRHNNPHSGGGYHRQVAADQLSFDVDGNIEQINPSHKGIGFLAKNVNPYTNLALGKKIRSSSYYDNNFKPEYIADDNNGTLWKAKNNTNPAWITIDFEKETLIKNVHTQFEFATWFYQYKLECSNDGKNWRMFADRSKNTIHGSPMVDVGNDKARYLKLTILNTEYPGLNRAVWNIKVYNNDNYQPKMAGESKRVADFPKPKGLLVSLNADGFTAGATVEKWPNTGKLLGAFTQDSEEPPTVTVIEGKKALIFKGNTSLKANVAPPSSLSGNSSFSVVMWVFNPQIADEEPIISWTERGGTDLTNASFGYGKNKKWGAAAHWGWPDMPFSKLPEAGKWHHLAIVFDGTNEHIYVDGNLDRKELKMLYLANLKNFVIGSNADKSAFFSGALASLKVYDIALSANEVKKMAQNHSESNVPFFLAAHQLNYGKQLTIKNEGSVTGSLTLSAEVEVKDVANKLAISLAGENQAKLYAEIMTYLNAHGAVNWVMEVYDGAWHQLIKLRSGEIYLDGVRKRLDKKWLPQAIASISSLNEGINAQAIPDLFKKWKVGLLRLPTSASFRMQPTAVSTELITMRAAKANLPGKVHHYLFTETSGNKGGATSGWLTKNEFDNFNVQANQKYAYTLKIKDNYGNVTSGTKAEEVSTANNLFNTYTETGLVPINYKLEMKNTIFDGLLGETDTVSFLNGKLKLSSTHTNWDGNGKNGPFLFKMIEGDFIVQAKIVDVSGLSIKKANGANDVGVMVRDSKVLNTLLQNSIFPGWGVGNMVTKLQDHNRLQFPTNSGWDYDCFLQIQRIADVFYVRSSKNGKDWRDLPGSPVTDLSMSTTVQVGLFQATYGEQSGFGIFEDFKIIQRKK